MLNKEITTILNEHNNEDGISHVIAESLIRYYSVNGFNAEDFKNKYLNYLRTIFLNRQFPFLDTEKLLSYKGLIFSSVMTAVRTTLLIPSGQESYTCHINGNLKPPKQF